MADLYYIEEGYYDQGYFVYTADAAAAPSSEFTLGCDATAIGAATEATADLTAAFELLITASKLLDTESALTSEFAVNAECSRLVEATIEVNALFTPSFTVEAQKNTTAVLDSTASMTVDASVNRSTNILLDHIADLNAMAAKTVDVTTAMAAEFTASTQATTLASAESSLNTSTTLSAEVDRVTFSGDISLSAKSSVYASKYMGTGRPRNLEAGTTYSSSVKKFGTHSVYPDNQIRTRWSSTTTLDGGLIPTSSDSWAFELWYYPTGTAGGERDLAAIGTNRLSNRWLTLFTASNGVDLTGRFYNTSGTLITGVGGTATLNTWNHIFLVSDGSRISLFINGTRTSTTTTNLPSSFFRPTSNGGLAIGSSSWTNRPYYDDASFHIGTTLGVDANDTTLTVPTSARVNDVNYTRVLLHFNNDGLDDIYETALAEVSLTSTAQVSATAEPLTKLAQAELTSTASLSADVGKTQPADSALSAEVTVSATAERIKTFDSNFSSQIELQTLAGTTKQADIAVSALFTPSVDASIQLAGVALFESTFEQTTQAAKTTDIDSSFENTVELSVSATVTAGLSAELTAQLSTTIFEQRLRFVSSDLNTQFDLNIDALKLRPVVADLVSESTVAADIQRYRLTSADTALETNLNADVDRFRLTTAGFSVETTVSATAIKIQQGQADLSSEFSQTTNATKDTDIVAALTVNAAVDATAVKTVDAIPELAALFTPTINADAQFAGFALLESTATLTASAGTIKEYAPKVNLGVRANGSTPRITLSGLPSQGVSIRQAGFTAAIWVKRETVGNVFQTIWMPWNSDSINVFPTYKTGLVFDNNNVRLRNVYNPDEPGATWSDVAPMDTDWHHIVLWAGYNIDNENLSTRWYLWIDGVYQGSATHSATMQGHTFANSLSVDNPKNFAQFGTGIGVNAIPNYDESSTTSNDISVAQFWVGNINQPIYKFPINEFYDGGYRDLGTTGRGEFNRLPEPQIYSVLSVGTTDFYVAIGDSPEPATEALLVPEPQANFNLSVEPQAVLVNTANLFATTAVQSNLSYTVSQHSAMSASTDLAFEATTRIGVVALLSVTASSELAIDKLTGYSASLNSQAAVAIIPGFVEKVNIDLYSEFTIDAGVDVKPPIRAEADLLTTAELVCDATSFSDNIVLMASAGDLVCDATLIPPIRIEANLSSEFTVTATVGSIEQFAALTASAGTMQIDAVKTTGTVQTLVSEFTQTVDAIRYKGIILELTAFNAVLTAGDVLNLDPFLQLKIAPETRTLTIRSETRTLTIEQETRTLTIQGWE